MRRAPGIGGQGEHAQGGQRAWCCMMMLGCSAATRIVRLTTMKSYPAKRHPFAQDKARHHAASAPVRKSAASYLDASFPEAEAEGAAAGRPRSGRGQAPEAHD